MSYYKKFLHGIPRLEDLNAIVDKLNGEDAIFPKIPNIAVGSVALASLGTNTTLVAGTLYVTSIFVPVTKVITGIGVLNGVTAGTDNGLVALFDASGHKVATSALAGALSAGANTFQERAFLTPFTARGPATYLAAYQQNGTTATIRTIATATFLNAVGDAIAGTFGTIPADITPPTTLTADEGPICYLY